MTSFPLGGTVPALTAVSSDAMSRVPVKRVQWPLPGGVRQRHGGGMMQEGSHRVVVGVDGSYNSLAALHMAVDHARQCHAALDIVYVLPPDACEAEVSDGAVMLEAIVGREFPGGTGGVAVSSRVENGDPAPILLGASVGAELLVIGGRDCGEQDRGQGYGGRDGAGRESAGRNDGGPNGGPNGGGHSRLFGSRTVGRCLEHGRCPVEVCVG